MPRLFSYYILFVFKDGFRVARRLQVDHGAAAKGVHARVGPERKSVDYSHQVATDDKKHGHDSRVVEIKKRRTNLPVVPSFLRRAFPKLCVELLSAGERQPRYSTPLKVLKKCGTGFFNGTRTPRQVRHSENTKLGRVKQVLKYRPMEFFLHIFPQSQR